MDILRAFLRTLSQKILSFKLLSFTKICCFILTVELLVFYCYFLDKFRPSSDKSFSPNWGPTAYYVKPYQETTLLTPRGFCEEPIFLLILIMSSYDNFEERQTIRESWANKDLLNYQTFYEMHKHFRNDFLKPTKERVQHFERFLEPIKPTGITDDFRNLKPRVKTLFILGKATKFSTRKSSQGIIRNESLVFQDLVQEDLLDSYRNLTLKVIFSFKWVKMNCLDKVAFILKTDDDTFVNVPNLVHYLLGGTIPTYAEWRLRISDFNATDPQNRLTQLSNLLMGRKFSNKREDIFRIGGSLKNNYPDFLSGSGYILSSDTVDLLFRTSLVTPLIALEDLYVTGVLAKKVDIPLQNNPLFDFNFVMTLCAYKAVISQSQMDKKDMREKAKFLLDPSSYCHLSPKLLGVIGNSSQVKRLEENRKEKYLL